MSISANAENNADMTEYDPRTFTYKTLISGCDFESVFFAVYVKFEDFMWSVPTQLRIRKLSKRYREDRNAGHIKPFRAYEQYARAIPFEPGRIEIRKHMLKESVKSLLRKIPEPMVETFFHDVYQSYYKIITKLNLNIEDPMCFAMSNVAGDGTLTGWMKTPKGNMRFAGIGKRRMFQNYLGEPAFEQKNICNDSWYHGDMRQAIDIFCTIWRRHPSILPIVAYGVLTIMHRPQTKQKLNGVILINFALEQPFSLVVTGRRRDSLAAVRVFSDTNFDWTASRYEESWLDTIQQHGNFFEPYVQRGYFQNITLFENNATEQLEPELLAQWRQSYAYGLHPVAWMPELKRTNCTEQDMQGTLRVKVRAGQGPIFPPGAFAQFAEAWRIILREYIIFLEALDDREFISYSVRFDSYRDWKEGISLDSKQEEFLRSLRSEQSVVFAFGQLLRWFEAEGFISQCDMGELLGLLLQELQQCVKLFCESELDRLHRYFDPIMAGKYPADQKRKPPYLFWNGQEQRTMERCLYIEANHWESDYRRITSSTASSTEIMRHLKPYLLQRPDQKALGLQRVYHGPNGKENRKVYVLCIKRKEFLKKQ